MKLRTITEGWEPTSLQQQSDERSKISKSQAAENLTYVSLKKLRHMLNAMDLLKGPNEPVPGVSNGFNSLRSVVNNLVARDAKSIIAGTDTDIIGKFWGYQFPADWYDTQSGQAGKTTADGTFDDIIRAGIDKASKLPPGDKGLKAKSKIIKNIGDELYHWHSSV